MTESGRFGEVKTIYMEKFSIWHTFRINHRNDSDEFFNL